MKVLVTGANGFIGKNLIVSLKRDSNIDIYIFNSSDDPEMLPIIISEVDFIFHLAGVNRPENDLKFNESNSDLTKKICDSVRQSGRNIPILFTSSIQAERPNLYGKSKLKAEMHLLNLYMETGNKVFIYRLPNVFGKWSKPNYNSVVATFCYNVSHSIPISIHDASIELDLVHIGAVITAFLDNLYSPPDGKLYLSVDPVYKISVGELAECIKKFKESRENLVTEKVGEGFLRVLYATYISYISPDQFNYPIDKYEDERGIFVEMLKTKDSGQFSFFTAYPNVTRGGHYHNVKTEKFLVIKGKARFGFRHIVTGEICEIFTSGDTPQIVETVPGWSHDITNIGNDEMVVMLWANESFNREKPDTVTYRV